MLDRRETVMGKRRGWSRGGGDRADGEVMKRSMHYVHGELRSRRPDPRWVLTEGTVARGRSLQSRAA